MRALAHRSCLVAALLGSACDASGISPGRSHIAANKLASAQVLSQQTIDIEREFDGPDARRLTYELRPDDTLIVTLEALSGPKTKAETESFPLSSQVAADARSKLWHVHPEQQGAGVKLPPDCLPQSVPDITVAFISPEPSSGSGNAGRAVFSLPSQSVCKTQQAIEARDLIAGVIHSFPPSNLQDQYSRRKWRSAVLVPGLTSPPQNRSQN